MPTKEHKKEAYSIPISSDDENEKQIVKGTRNKYAKIDLKHIRQYMFWFIFTMFFIGIACCITIFTIPSLQNQSIGGLGTWQWCLLITALLGGPVLSRFISTLVWLLADNKFLSINPVYYTVKLVASAWAVFWFSIILLAWTWVVNKPSFLGVKPDKHDKLLHLFATEKRIVTKTLITILLGSFLWLIKMLLIMIGKTRFHVLRFFDRIRESLKEEFWILTLSSGEKRPKKVLSIILKEKYVCGKKEIREYDLASLETVDLKNVSNWAVEILVDDIMEGKRLEYVISDDIDGGGKKKLVLNTKEDAKKAAGAIFSTLVCDAGAQDSSSCTEIDKERLQETLETYFTDKEVKQVLQWLLEGADCEKISNKAFDKCLMRSRTNREDLVRALRSNKELFVRLSISVDFVLVIVVLIVWMVMLNVEIRKAMVVVGSFIIGSAFIIGDLCKNMVNSFTFVFVAHPFDVGDRCLIQNTPVIIHEINLLTTIAFTLDGEKIFYSNSQLLNLNIINYTRSSPQMGDSIVFSLNINTPERKIEQLKLRIESYIREHIHDWMPEYKLVTELQDTSTIKATLRFTHTINFHDLREIETRKSRLTLEIKKILEDLKMV